MKYFKLFAHNILVEGDQRCAVYNLQQKDLQLIPPVLYDIAMLLADKTVEEVQQIISPDRPDFFQKFIQYLLDKDLGFLTDTPEQFPSLSLEWDFPNHILNAIAVRDQDSTYDFEMLINQLDELLCKHLEIRLLDKQLDAVQIRDLLNPISKKTFRTVSLLLNDSEKLDEKDLTDIYQSFPKIDQMLVFNSSKSNPKERAENIFFSAKSMQDCLTEARAADKPFVNIDYFIEAQYYNPFYNRKVCIDEKGNIKNDLMLESHHGNLQTSLLTEVVRTAAYQKLWHAKPDKIEGIKDSPLRYASSLAFPLEEIAPGEYRCILNQEENQKVFDKYFAGKVPTKQKATA